MKRTTLLVLNAHFGTAKWLGELFPKVEEYKKLSQIKPNCVLAFEGGVDIASSLYKEKASFYTQKPSYQRDMIERSAFRKAVQVGAGSIGICRGAQLACALSGGSLIQHVTGHHVAHWIATSDKHNFMVTSCHHQMMYPFDMKESEYDILAWTSDNKARNNPISTVYVGENDDTDRIPEKEPEVVWFPKTNALAVQGHPEWANKDGLFQTYCRDSVKKYLIHA